MANLYPGYGIVITYSSQPAAHPPSRPHAQAPAIRVRFFIRKARPAHLRPTGPVCTPHSNAHVTRSFSTAVRPLFSCFFPSV